MSAVERQRVYVDPERELEYRMREDDQRHRALLNDLRIAGVELNRYGGHIGPCVKWSTPQLPCTCGFDAARDRIRRVLS